MKITRYAVGMLGTNCYLVTDEKTGCSFVVDPGDHMILNKLENTKNIKYILLTHAHFDHVMGTKALKGETGANVAIYTGEAEAMNDPMLNMSGFFGMDSIPGFAADVLLHDGGTLECGELKIKVIHTPGHSRGGVCYIVEDVIFSGDTLFLEGVGRTDGPGGNFSSLRQSIGKLFGMDGDYTVYPGHGEPTTLEHERKYNPLAAD